MLLADPNNCHHQRMSVLKEKGRGVVVQQPVRSVLTCAISMGREWPGRCIAPTGLLNIYAIAQYAVPLC